MSHSIYPKRCVPKKGYKIIEQGGINLLRKKYVIRYSEGNIPLNDKKALDDNLKTNMSSNKFKSGLSVTLIGVSLKEDAKYIICGNRADALVNDWTPGEMVLKVRREDFEYTPKRGFYGLLVDKILECYIVYSIKNKDGVEERTDLIKYELVHKPTHCNYWHFCIFPYGTRSDTGEKYYLRDEMPTKTGAKTATKNIASVLKTYAMLSCDVTEKPIRSTIYREKRGIRKLKNKRYHNKE